MNKRHLIRVWSAIGGLLLLSNPAQAQWLTQSFALKAGWNAVYLHVDPSHVTLDDWIAADAGNPIQEIWLWQPAANTGQFVTTPQEPTSSASQWVSWVRLAADSGLVRLPGNAACLVRVSADTSTFTWTVKGKPVPPRYEWTTTGLNFLGFPAPAAAPPTFETFLTQAPELQQNAQIFQYLGGDLGANNPARLYTLSTAPVRRGEAVWIRSGEVYNRYYGPFQVSLQNLDGVKFGDTVSQYSLRLRNLGSKALVVTAGLVDSEAVPSGQTAIVGVPPLLLRGARSTVDLSYGYSAFSGGSKQWTLQPSGQVGSEAEVVLGLNRSQMSAAAGSQYAAILRLTDSLGLSQVDVPVTASTASNAGLWVGAVAVNQVRHYLVSYATNASGELQTVNGAYVPASTNVSLGSVPRAFPLRLIVHQNASGQSVLLQRVFVGPGLATNPVVATAQSCLLADSLSSARRISAVHLPWSTGNTPWSFVGDLRQGGSLTTTVELAHDDQASNPFLHTYHPDHDNLDAAFSQTLARGEESYGVSRQLTLTFTAPADNFGGLTAGSQTLSGTYDEQLVFKGKTKSSATDTRQFDVRGSFTLKRISDISTLTKP